MIPSPLAAWLAIIFLTITASSVAAGAEKLDYVSGKADELASQIDAMAKIKPPPRFEQVSEFATPHHVKQFVVLSTDGKRLAMMQKDGKLATWDIDQQKKLAEFSLSEETKEGSLSISPDGKLVAFSTANKKIELFDGENGKLLQTFDAMKWQISDARLSLDGNRIYAIGRRGQMFIAQTDGKVVLQSDEETTETDADNLIADWKIDKWLKVIPLEDRLSIYFQTNGEDFFYQIPKRNPPNLASMNGHYAIASGGDLWVGPYSADRYTYFLSKQWLINVDFNSATSTVWSTTWTGVEIRPLNCLLFPTIAMTPIEWDTSMVWRTAPNARRLVSHRFDGTTKVFRLIGSELSTASEVNQIIDQLIVHERFDVLDKLGQLWVDRTDNYVGDLQSTYYGSLTNRIVNTDAVPLLGVERAELMKKWMEQHPDSQLFRICMARMYLEIAMAKRGRALAFKVTPEQWAGLDEYTQKAWETLEPMLDDEKVPPETYDLILWLARYRSWSPEETNAIIDRALKECPTYRRLWAQEMTSRLPRWGGEQGSGVALAQKVADQVGGAEGDKIYAAMARSAYSQVGWEEVFGVEGFSVDRVLNGMLVMLRESPDMDMENRALFVARLYDKRQAAREVVDLMADHGHTYDTVVWKFDVPKFQEAVKWAKTDPPAQQENDKSPK